MKYYKNLLGSCLGVLLTIHSAGAQILWQGAAGTKDFDENSSAFIPVPGGYLNVGTGAADGTGRQPQQLYLSKVDEAGKVLWQRGHELANARVLYTQGAVANKEGQVYVTVIGANDPSSASNYSSGTLVKFTPTGDTLWTRRVAGSPGLNASLSAVVLAPDEGVVTIGNQGTTNFIAKYSPTGQLLWRYAYVYSALHPGYLQQLGRLPTGFLVVCSPNRGDLPPKYLILDADGQLVSEKPSPSFYPLALQPERSGGLLAAGGRWSRISPLGDTLGSRRYRRYGADIEVQFAAETLRGGRYLLAGTRPDGATRDVALLLVDQTGTVLRDTLLVRTGADEVPTGVAFDPAGNYVIGGYATDGPVGRVDQFVIKVRQWDRGLATTPAASRVATAYYLFPNPAASDELRVANDRGSVFAGSYEIWDVTGRVVQVGRTTPARAINLRALPVGLYLVRLKDGTRWLPALRLSRI